MCKISASVFDVFNGIFIYLVYMLHLVCGLHASEMNVAIVGLATACVWKGWGWGMAGTPPLDPPVNVGHVVYKKKTAVVSQLW